MTTLQAVLLGILQGIAEFLPISSSGHLTVAQKLFGLDDVPLLFDVLLHIASLFAVIIVFRKTIAHLLCVFGRMIVRKPAADDKPAQSMIFALIAGTCVTGVLGIVFSKLIPDLPIQCVCVGFLITAALLVVSSRYSGRRMPAEAQPDAVAKTQTGSISVPQGLAVGFAQGIGVLPGISRSGITVSALLLAGVDRNTAGEFSFLLSIPAILGAFLLEIKDLDSLTGSIDTLPLVLGCAAAFLAGLAALTGLLKLIRKGKLAWFALYLVPLGIAGLIFF